MRNECPVCGSENLIKDWNMTYVVPENWTLPTNNEICLCKDCHLIFYNNDKTQADYSEYYSKYYGYDSSLTGESALQRLHDIAILAMKLCPDKKSIIVDFGGGAGFVEKELRDKGYVNVFTVNPDEYIPDDVDLIISSQVFEHLYDIHATMKVLLSHIKPDGKFLIELPEARDMLYATKLPLLDVHQKHCNHFPSYTLDLLFDMYGYSPTYQIRDFEESHFGFIYRAVYVKSDPIKLYYDYKKYVENNISIKMDQLKKIDYPVQIFGLGDICLHLLSKVKLNIVGFIDNDPAYKGQTVMGIPVTTNILSDVPIVVIAQNQQYSILKDIKNRGLTNEVIII